MSQKVKVGGVWKDATPYAKVGGTWKLPKSVYNKIDGYWKSSFLQAGVNDIGFTTYDVANGFNNEIRGIHIQPDEKILVVGGFTNYNGSNSVRIVRFNSDGTRDTSFNTGTGFNATLFKVITRPDGKILVGGVHSTFNGVTKAGFIVLNSDGTADTSSYTTNFGTGISTGGVYNMALQPDGKLILVGTFTIWNGTTVNRIVRLNADGTRDTTFTTNTGTATGASVTDIRTVKIQSDGKIVLGGQFTTWNGATVNRIVRLNADGTQDTAFTTNTGTGTDSVVYDIEQQSDGKLIVVGAFAPWNGTAVNNIVRLNTDGTRDTTFTTNNGSGANAGIHQVRLDSSGKIILAGISMTTWNGTTVNRIARLNTNGTLDTTFTTNAGTGFNDQALALAIQSNDKILVGGYFTSFNSTSAISLVRLNSDGTRDSSIFPAFGTAANRGIIYTAVRSDGKIAAAGDFTSWNGSTVGRFIMLNSDGSVDTSFNTNVGTAANNTVGILNFQSDGKLLVGGAFAPWNGVTVGNIVRLNSDGTRDTTFTTNAGTGASARVRGIVVQSDGKIVLSGDFTTWNGTTVNRIVRLNSDGTRDTTFTTNTGTGANAGVLASAIQSDGKTILIGQFTTWNGTAVGKVVRLNTDGTRDTTFSTNIGTGAVENWAEAIAIQSDGKILIGGEFTTWNGTTVNRIVRLNSDGTRDTTFTTNAGTGASGGTLSIVVQSDGKIVIGGGGNFTTWNGTTVNRIVRLNSDGTRDTAFTNNTGSAISATSEEIRTMSTQPNGKLIIAGIFQSFNQTLRTNIARIGGDFAG